MEKRPNNLPFVQLREEGKLPRMTVTESAGQEISNSPNLPKTTTIDMRLFSIPLNEVEPGRYYQVRFKGRRTWNRALRREKLWLADGDLVGRVENTADVRPSEQEVMAVVDRVAQRMLTQLEYDDGPGLRQHYIDKELLGGCDSLLGENVPVSEESYRRRMLVYRAVRLAAAVKATPSLPLSEFPVGYCVAGHDGTTVFESLAPEDALMHAQENPGAFRQALGVVFADGSVRFGHALAQRPWLRER